MCGPDGLGVGGAGGDDGGCGQGGNELESGLEGEPFGFGAEFDAVEAFADLAVGDPGFGVESFQGDQFAGTAEMNGGCRENIFEVGALAGEVIWGDGLQRVRGEQEDV